MMNCIKCAEKIVEIGKEPDLQYNGEGTYINCPNCETKHFVSESKDN
jgi:DNA-directed RNA polymerase subunit RPC12/RpoP